MSLYPSDVYYSDRDRRTRPSARAIVPRVIEIAPPIRSVVDVGCGVGTWLSVFKEHGVEDVWGVEGGWVDPSYLVIPQERLSYADLTLPIEMGRWFDLAISLEVAEHLPPASASIFVDSLTRLAPLVLFSAAIPGQGGMGHVNEQWPSYWVERFDEHGYEVVDCIRKRVWEDARRGEVEWFYAQNTLLFARRDCIESHPGLRRERELTDVSLLSIVHPNNYVSKWKAEHRLTLAQSVRALRRSLVESARDRVRARRRIHRVVSQLRTLAVSLKGGFSAR